MPGLAGLMRGRVGMAWMPVRQAVENVNSGVTIGGEDNSSPLFVRPPWQARLLIPIEGGVLAGEVSGLCEP